jgi:hypothetical protein
MNIATRVVNKAKYFTDCVGLVTFVLLLKQPR